MYIILSCNTCIENYSHWYHIRYMVRNRNRFNCDCRGNLVQINPWHSCGNGYGSNRRDSDNQCLFEDNCSLDLIKIKILQQSCSYIGPDKLPVCEYYHNRPNLVFIDPSVVLWRCPYGIGKIIINSRMQGVLNILVFI